MDIKSNVTIHNRFDVELRDSRTGELKQTATAYNIVLNQMYDRLCAGSAYFANIGIGRGTGTLDPTRTTLFNYWGYKAATTVETIKADPVSSWKRKIELGLTEYNGTPITEVGIMYGTGSTNFVTHAFLEDSEGNPISITKTDTDILTIYATVFATVGISIPGAKLVGMPNSNNLVNYMMGGSWTNGSFEAGAAPYPSVDGMSGLASTPALGSVATTWSADTANKKRTSSVPRLGTTVANGHIAEINLSGYFRLPLPISGVFTGQPYTGVALGTGDGVEDKFLLPSKNVDQGSVVVKLDGVETTAFTKANVCRTQNFQQITGVTLAGEGTACALSADGTVLAVTHKAAPAIRTFDWNGSAWIARANPSSLPATNGQGCSLSADGTILAVSQSSSPYISTYDWIDGAWVRRSNPASLPVNSGYCCKLSADGNVLAVGSYSSSANGIAVYDWTGGAWVKRTTPPSLPATSCQGITISDDGTLLVGAMSASPYVVSYDWSGSAWTKRANPDVLPPSFSYGAALSSNKNILAIAHAGSPYITVYDWSGGIWTKRANPSSLPTYEANSCYLTPDGGTMAVGFGSGSAVNVYDWDGATWTKRDTPLVPVGLVYGCVISPDEGTLIVAHTAGTRLSAYDISPLQTEIAFNTPPAAGVAITADYTVNGVHKTSDYVIDLGGVSIQFGEVV
ncbi:WD40 repeat domain-containing protein [Anaerotalea alkaliphila]|uniref:Uncharacterized protein n=1 Tax=Anaerotalea alkaliphila TaxID=2662126 RepID=A0A7X5KNP6_9FIRM|nr:WD40 repeat domain-containing protein [Anaerotalea alkaliphila]NDL68013.1 hypothetical protein [Anaerotalea alkaliphila]